MKYFILMTFIISLTYSAPVDQYKQPENDVGKDPENLMNDLGLEYGRYLQEVVAVLEEDKDFAKKLENVSADHIKSGAIAHELNFVNHNVRTKLDELKRIEIERLRKLAKQEHDTKEFGLGSYSDDGRRWRTLGSTNHDKLDKHMSQFEHLDHKNPNSFEAEDLHKLIIKATRDLQELDKKRREEFKRYELEKEHQFRESLKNMTEEQKKEAMKKHEELQQKHKEHPRVHHPGSKQQLEEVWEEQDHMPKEEFNPKTFFALHDVNGDGYLDPEEVEALLSLEIKKMYDPNNPEDDPNEMEEEYHRMREHIYKEADKNKDGLISRKEFIELTQKSDFEKDEGWRGLDEQQLYNEDELRQYEARRQEYLNQQYGYYMPQYQPYMPQGPGQGYPPPHHGQGPPPHHGQGPPPQQFGNVPQYQMAPPQGGGYPQHHPQQAYQNQPQFGVHPNAQHDSQYQPQHDQGHPNQQYYGQQHPPPPPPHQQQQFHPQQPQIQSQHQAYQMPQQQQVPQHPQQIQHVGVGAQNIPHPQAGLQNQNLPPPSGSQVKPQPNLGQPSNQYGAPNPGNIGRQQPPNVPQPSSGQSQGAPVKPIYSSMPSSQDHQQNSMNSVNQGSANSNPSQQQHPNSFNDHGQPRLNQQQPHKS